MPPRVSAHRGELLWSLVLSNPSVPINELKTVAAAEKARRRRAENPEYCRELKRKWRNSARARQQAREYQRKWAAANRSHLLEYKRERYAADRERAREAGRKRYIANRERIKASARRRYALMVAANGRDLLNRQGREWRSANPGRHAVYSRNYRAHKKRAISHSVWLAIVD